MLEFDTDETRKRIIDGGPWRHRGDALLVIPYNRLSPQSLIVMNSIGLWTQFYDLLDVLRKDEHARKLGSRLGQMLRTDMSYPNYVKVRIMYPLANTLVASTKVHIQGRSDMVVVIRYENVPFFWFICGRIGHSNKECPEGEVGA
jgi:hypothetical protein